MVIRIVGLGPGAFGQLPLENYQILKEAKDLYLRTAKHPIVERLGQEGIAYQSFDDLYDRAADFSEVYRQIAGQLKELSRQGIVTYAVPGHPLVAEDTVKLLLADPEVATQIYPAMSCVDAVFAALALDPVDGITVLDALSLGVQDIDTRRGMLLLQSYSQHICSEVKLTLMECYPDDFQVCLVKAAGITGQERVEWLPLYQLDRQPWVDHLTSIYIPPIREARAAAARVPLDPLVEIMETLRGKRGCPWDKHQTHHSLRRYAIEEAYEVVDAIEQEDMYKLCEELGDLLLQVVFHAQIAKENGYFDMSDVVRGIVDKMIRRHPHVFGEGQADTPDEVRVTWEEIKEMEKQEKTGEKPDSIIDVPLALPALMLAEKVQSQVSRVGFDWENPGGALAKIREELDELTEVVETGDKEGIKEELGDFLFAAVNVARLLRLSPEEVLKQSVNKFISRFRYIEEKAKRENVSLVELDIEAMENWWQESKKVIG